MKKIIKNKKTLNFTFLISIAILLLTVLPTSFGANEVFITFGENITDGITATDPGGTLFLGIGTYNKVRDRNIVIDKDITIQGLGSATDVIIDARNLSRIFTIGSGVQVKFINITFTNGNTPTYPHDGGAIFNEFTNSKITIINCTFTYNKANNDGGAIYNRGPGLNIANSSFSNNSAGGGGAIRNLATGDDFKVINCSFTNNSAIGGAGAIWNTADGFSVAYSIFTNNKANDGGAILNSANDGSVANSYFISNEADRNGGAILHRYYSGFIIVNSTFIANLATLGSAFYQSNSGTSSITFSVFLSNTNHAIYVESGACALEDNFYFWFLDGNNRDLTSFIANTVHGTVIGSFYYLNIDNNPVSYVGEMITIESELRYEGTGIANFASLPVLNDISLIYNNQICDSYNYKDNINLAPIQLTSTSNILNFYLEDILIHPMTIDLLKYDTYSTINIPGGNFRVGDTDIIDGVATDENNEPIANTIVTIRVGNDEYTNETDINGFWSLAIVLSASGNVIVSVNWTGNETHNGFRNSTNFNVEKLNTDPNNPGISTDPSTPIALTNHNMQSMPTIPTNPHILDKLGGNTPTKNNTMQKNSTKNNDLKNPISNPNNIPINKPNNYNNYNFRNIANAAVSNEANEKETLENTTNNNTDTEDIEKTIDSVNADMNLELILIAIFILLVVLAIGFYTIKKK